MSNLNHKVLLPFFLGIVLMSSAALTGCDSEGPAEEAGEKIDESVNDAKRAVKDAAD